MTAGRRDTFLVFERESSAQDAYGQEIETWAPIDAKGEWAAVLWGRGDERRAAAQEGGSQSATFQVLDHPGTRAVTIRDRIDAVGSKWDITGLAFINAGEIEFTAVRAL